MPQIVTRTVQANGLSFAVDEAGEGDTVALLLHGFPEARQMWRPLLPTLATLGWRAAAPDMRGYGDTSRPKGKAAYRARHLAADVGALFEALGARRRILIGHDWGGVVAWMAALRGVPMDALVVLNAPHPAIYRRALKAGWAQRRRSWYIAWFQLPVLPERQLTKDGGEGIASVLRRQSPRFSEELLELYKRNICVPGAATAMLNYYRAAFHGLGRSLPPGQKLQVPTLMLWGEKDRALDLSLTEGNEAYVADFTLHRIPRATHWVMQDAPQVVAGRIAEWARGKGLAA